jgi:hypothetical protein
VEGLNDRLIRGQQRLEAVEADNRRLMQVRHYSTVLYCALYVVHFRYSSQQSGRL